MYNMNINNKINKSKNIKINNNNNNNYRMSSIYNISRINKNNIKYNNNFKLMIPAYNPKI